MQIGLVSLSYPPDSTEGVARQRKTLARGLAGLGHDVHVVTLGDRERTRQDLGVTVHEYPVGDIVNEFVASLPVLDRPLSQAQRLCEGVQDLAERVRLDVVDVPLWLAQGFALVRQPPCPVVVWLQTTLMHLIELQKRGPRPHEKVLVDIDRYCLSHATGCIADSQSILDDAVRLYDIPDLRRRTIVVHPGLSDTVQPRTRPAKGSSVKALVVGRLEHRKGTALLFEALPRMLTELPQLEVTFVGRDNSVSDGFRRETGLTYPEAFAQRHPALKPRVRFLGHVDDPALEACYTSADLLLHPALYESFGLIFLEAMRVSLPTIAFGAGGAAEVFARGESDGGLLCPPGDVDALRHAVVALATDPARRTAMGHAARQRFESGFADTRMAQQTADAYLRLLEEGSAKVIPPRRSGRLFQVMEALQDRDAVSRIARANAPTIAACGGERRIMAVFAEKSVRAETGRLRGARFHEDDAAIFHYWGYSRLEHLIRTFPGRKAVHYHNITPSRFFAPRSPQFEMTTRGYAQLERIADSFDLVIGDSHYNLETFAEYMSLARPMFCVYPTVDAHALQTADWDHDCAARVATSGDDAVWLFVGRFARNKRQDRIIEAFNHFYAATGRGQLCMVGDRSADPGFVNELECLTRRLPTASRITLVPSVTDTVLRAYYRAADLFVCASEHEGFCVPLAEAMAFDIPIIALDRGAVGETLGGSGVLVREWDPERVAQQAADVLETPASRRALVAQQRARLAAFAPDAVRHSLRAAVDSLTGVRNDASTLRWAS